MGVDARIYIMGIRFNDVSESLLHVIGTRLSYGEAERYYYAEIVDGCFVCVWLEGMQRYYSAIYPRGDWPDIKAAILAVQTAFPDHEIRYGSDHDNSPDEADIVTDEMLAKFDMAWEWTVNSEKET